LVGPLTYRGHEYPEYTNRSNLMFQQTSNPQYSQFIALSRYARFDDNLGRREMWPETVSRLTDFWVKKFPEQEEYIKNDIHNAILNLEVMPSMRSLMTAGKALDKCNVAGYNCSFVSIESPRDFDEILYVLMNGTGVGFSVERQSVNKLPEIAESFYDSETIIKVKDSKLGWAKAFKELLSLLWQGEIPKWDMSEVRPKGSRLKTFGGRASGPEPLDALFKFSVNMFKKAKGRKLTSIECHDLVCKIAEIVVVGGVRRSALISLSNLSDDRMRNAKSGQWWIDNTQRALANNSYVADERPDFEVFMEEWVSLYKSRSGERGIFSRTAAKKQAEKTGRRETDHDFGTNPCSEIILRSKQMCNLSEVVVRADDTLDTLKKKVEIATVLGTLQSSLVAFRYLRKKWIENTQEEALLGVSLTGIMDHPAMSGSQGDEILTEWLTEMKKVYLDVNKNWAKMIGVNESTSIGCVKPSGTVSQLCDSGSGIHPRFSQYYIRTVRNDKKDPLSKFMIDNGFYHEEDVMNPSNWVFYFPMKAPDSCVTADDMGAIRQLELWKVYQEHWCEHKPSMTCYYKDDEFLKVGQWLWDNFDDVSGISFLPLSDHVYQQAPYTKITEEEYHEWVSKTPQDVDWSELVGYESTDNTTGVQMLSCSSGVCEI